MQRSLIAAIVGVYLIMVTVTGCSKSNTDAPTAKDKDQQFKSQLIGKWVRDVGLITYKRDLQSGGDLVMQEFSSADLAAGRQPAPTKELKGKWAFESDHIIYQVAEETIPRKEPLKDPLQIKCKLEKVTPSEYVESTQGVDGPVQVKFTREGSAVGKTSKLSATTSK
jgi:hypothetical protein